MQGRIQDFFKGVLDIIYKNYTLQLFTLFFNQQSACKYLLCKKLQPTRCCSCSYYALMLLYVCMVIYSLTQPDFISCRGAIACSISAYTASDNTLMRSRVWPSETRSFVLSALPHEHFNPIASVLLSKSFNASA